MASQGRAKPSKEAADLKFLTGCCFTNNGCDLLSMLDGLSPF